LSTRRTADITVVWSLPLKRSADLGVRCAEVGARDPHGHLPRDGHLAVAVLARELRHLDAKVLADGPLHVLDGDHRGPRADPQGLAHEGLVDHPVAAHAALDRELHERALELAHVGELRRAR
jgi:hypothetical protein